MRTRSNATTGSDADAPRRSGLLPALRGRLADALERPVDIASLAAFRILFGALMCAAMIRFIQSGWIERFYGDKVYFFKYWGLSWIPVASVDAIQAVYVGLAVLAFFIAIGFLYRVSIVLFFLGFTYTELLDVTNYLNHYYLVTLLALLMCFMPLGRAWSVDARMRPGIRSRTAPGWALWLLRFQIAVVYIYAGLAKFNTDWLVHAQPLNIWLSARVDTPILGAYFDQLWMAYLFSWMGFLYDATIVFWLSWKRTRLYAYAVVLAFHTMTNVLFNIGLFPYIMTVAALLFFSPSWPRRLLAFARHLFSNKRVAACATSDVHAPKSTRGMAQDDARPGRTRLRRLGFALMAVYCALQVLVPLRHYAYPGDVAWNEEGMRWSWKVMLREKHGSITYYVRFPDTGRELQVPPRFYLDARQEREMAGQPDLILALAHRIADDFQARGAGDVEVRVEALVSWNGRPAALMIDPTRDLARERDGLAPKDWILPAPHGPPIQLRPLSDRRSP